MLIETFEHAEKIRDVWRHLVFVSTPEKDWHSEFYDWRNASIAGSFGLTPEETGAAGTIRSASTSRQARKRVHRVPVEWKSEIAIHTPERAPPIGYLWPVIEAYLGLSLPVPTVIPCRHTRVSVRWADLPRVMFRLMEIREMARDPKSDFFLRGPVLLEARLEGTDNKDRRP